MLGVFTDAPVAPRTSADAIYESAMPITLQVIAAP
jgi:hypothetical protein